MTRLLHNMMTGVLERAQLISLGWPLWQRGNDNRELNAKWWNIIFLPTFDLAIYQSCSPPKKKQTNMSAFMENPLQHTPKPSRKIPEDETLFWLAIAMMLHKSSIHGSWWKQTSAPMVVFQWGGCLFWDTHQTKKNAWDLEHQWISVAIVVLLNLEDG